MPRPNHRQRRRLKAKAIGVTNSIDAFRWNLQFDRLNILVEGDSWFAYPKEWLIFGPNSNVIDHIFTPLVNKGLVNTLCQASNGDTARAMLNGKQISALTKLLRDVGADLDLMLLSAGGNDVVGPDDLAPLLRTFEAGFAAEDCIDEDRFSTKLANIIKSYRRLLDLRDRHAPQMHIICHTYDFVEPSDVAAEFLWGVEVTGPWISPTLDKKNIPHDLGEQVIRLMLIRFAQALAALELEIDNRFHVVNTQGTLTPGNTSDWLNEIHPTPAGFKKIARKVYRRMRQEFPQLPGFDS